MTTMTMDRRVMCERETSSAPGTRQSQFGEFGPNSVLRHDSRFHIADRWAGPSGPERLFVLHCAGAGGLTRPNRRR